MQFKIIKNLLSKRECEDISREFNKLNLKFGPTRYCEGYCQNLYNFEYVSMIQKLLTPIISDEFDKNLGISYCYTRKYSKNATLVPHNDRPACEYSLTLHVKSSNPDVPWPIYFEINGKKESIILNQGDCCLYKGCELKHERGPCPVNWYLQTFLHWVDLEGEHKEYVNDTRF